MPRWRVRPWVALLTASLVGAASSASWAQSVAADHSVGYMSSSATVGCETEATCKRWDARSPDKAHTWEMSDSRSSAGQTASHTLEFEQRYTPGGAFTSAVIKGHLAASMEGSAARGTGVSGSATYRIEFEPLAPRIQITGLATATTRGGSLVLSIASYAVYADCDGEEELELEIESDAGAGYPATDADTLEIAEEVAAAPGAWCEVRIVASTNAAANRPAGGESGSIDLAFELTVTTPGCAIKGYVTDGAFDGGAHYEALAGVRVQLWDAAGAVGEPVATERDGAYCLRADPAVEPGDYAVRATLADEAHTPPLFETRLAGEDRAAYVEVPVSSTDFGGTAQVAIDFDRGDPRNADLANIHWQTERFLFWLTDTMGVPAATLDSFIVAAFNPEGTAYLPNTNTVRIQGPSAPGGDDSGYAERDGPHDGGPENAEWHEAGHHIGNVLGIAPSDRAPECAGRVNHGGWQNTTTCDSLLEGFAVWVAGAASVDLDAGLGEGYADAWYANFWSLEANEIMAWTSQNGANGTTAFREDFAVAALLWDLADDTPTEDAQMAVADPENPGADEQVGVRDSVALGARQLLNVMIGGRPNTVRALYEALVTSPQVPADLKRVTVDAYGDDGADLSPLDVLFLIHGFHPVSQPTDPRYNLGDPISRTDHLPGAAGLVARNHSERLEGAEIRLVNPSGEAVTATIEIMSGSETRTITELVAANAEVPVHVELAPYWRQILAPGDPLPACGLEGERPQRITLGAPGMTRRILSGCDYAGLVVASTDGAALSYDVAPGGGASAAPGEPPTAVGGPSDAGPGAALLLVVVGAFGAAALAAVILRRRRASG